MMRLPDVSSKVFPS